MTDLKSHGAEIVRQTKETGRPIVLTKHGRGVAVVMALEDYEDLRETVERHALRQAVTLAEQQLDDGQFVAHEVMVEKLRRRSSGNG